jgi:hypothetical protein
LTPEQLRCKNKEATPLPGTLSKRQPKRPGRDAAAFFSHYLRIRPNGDFLQVHHFWIRLKCDTKTDSRPKTKKPQKQGAISFTFMAPQPSWLSE